jgi:dTDP-4-dehydrorhamnose reductase
MNSTKVLIVGAKGNLGQELVKIFGGDSKYRVISWDREEIDITNQNQVEEKISELSPRILINAAAYNAVDKCEEPVEFEIAQKINGEAVGFLARAAKKVGAIIIHYSTDYVFDGENKEGYKEDDKPNPINNYAKSKFLGEQRLRENANEFYLIRLSRLFGRPGASPFSKESFIDLMLRLARDRKELEVVDEEASCFTYAPDLAAATKNVIEAKVPFGIYHRFNEGAYTWYGATIKIFEEAGVKTEVIPVTAEKFPRSARRPKYSILLNTKLPPLRSFEEALREYLGKYK